MPKPRRPDPDRQQSYPDARESYRGTRRQAPGRQQPMRVRRRWGSLPGLVGVLLIICAAALGAMVTAAARNQPGNLLGAFLVAGTLAAVLAVRRRAVYLIIPAPALAYVIAATVAGLDRDHVAGMSRTAVATSVAQWVAGGFLAMTAGTILAIAVTIARWPRRGRKPRLAAGPRGPRDGRPARDPPARRRPQRKAARPSRGD